MKSGNGGINDGAQRIVDGQEKRWAQAEAQARTNEVGTTVRRTGKGGLDAGGKQEKEAVACHW